MKLIYSLEARPPLLHTIALGLQYTCMMFPYLIIVVILDRTQGSVSSAPISFCLIALAISSLLQSINKGFLGSGYLVPPVVSAIYFPASMKAALQGGLHLVYGMTLIAGVIEILFSCVIHKIRKLFPPLITGLIIIAVGFQLGLLATSQALAIKQWDDPLYPRNVIASLITLALMIALSIWARGLWRLLSPFIGIALGFVLSMAFGIVPSLQSVEAAPWIALPKLDDLGYHFSWDLVLPFSLAAIASSLRTVGAVTTCQKMNDPAWKSPNMANIKKGIRADGVGCVIGGLLGVPGLNTAPSLVGVSQATGATSRCIAYAIAAWLLALSLFPKFIHLFLAIPLPVMGAALLFTASFMIAGGIDLITSQKMDTRAIFIVGVSLILGISQPVFSEYYAQLPSWAQMCTNSPLSIITLSSFFLNLFFRLGIQQKAIINIRGEGTFTELLENKTAAWGLQAALVERVHTSFAALIGQLKRGCLKEDTIQVELIHEPTELTLQCTYKGTLPQVRVSSSKERGLIEETAFTEGLENYYLNISADQTTTMTREDACSIRLYFHI